MESGGASLAVTAMVEGQRSRPTTGLSPDEKRKMVDDALEYALDAAVTERPANLLQFVSGKLREWGPERERLRAAPHRHTRLVLNAGDDGAVKLQMDVLPVPGIDAPSLTAVADQQAARKALAASTRAEIRQRADDVAVPA